MTTKKVNGVEVELTPEEEAQFRAEQSGTLGDYKKLKYKKLSEIAKYHRTKGFSFNGIPIKTDDKSLALLQGTNIRNEDISFKQDEGDFVTISSAEQQSLREAIYDFVQGNFSNEGNLTNQIKNVGSDDSGKLSQADKDLIDAIDLNQGWA